MAPSLSQSVRSPPVDPYDCEENSVYRASVDEKVEDVAKPDAFTTLDDWSVRTTDPGALVDGVPFAVAQA
jgi:hypothetical protein